MTATRNTRRVDDPATDPPLSARSVIASTLLGNRPPVLPTRILVRSGALFGIAEGTTRVALSRMVAAGELEPDGDGYRLAGHLLSRLARQDLSRQGSTRQWSNRWRIEVVVAGTRTAAERSALRYAATQLRLAELREGVWTRPDNLGHRGLDTHVAVIAQQCRGFVSRPDGDPADLAESLWDLPAWGARAAALRHRLTDLVGPLERDDLSRFAEGFVLSAAVLRHFQADPLLPAALLPTDWPGTDLRQEYTRFDTAFRTLWRDWYRSQDPT